MCGIIGVINTKEENKEIAKKIFKSVVIANEVRGKDSTGVLAIDRERNEFSLFKDTIPASKFMNRKKFRQSEGDIWIGHTRFATTGEVNIRNAHPLQRREVFLVHNGVISNHIDIGKSLNFEHEVDSEILIPIVEDKDWDLLQDIKGSANFIAWNRKESELYIERHDNPLHCLTLKELGIIIFSSTESVLEFVSSHYSSGDEVFEFPDDTLVVLDMLGNTKGEKLTLEFPVEIVSKVSSPVSYGSVGYNYLDDDERYPYYSYDEGRGLFSNKGKADTSARNDDEEEDEFLEENFCEVCGNEIAEDEYEFGMHEWGVPLCYTCLTELGEAEKTIRDGGTIDTKSKKWENYKDLLEPYINY